jgi:GNAT superfamily N-acetyltransferase
LLSLLTGRGYEPIEFSSVLFRPIEPDATGRDESPGVKARRIEADDATLWTETAAEGWSSESPDLGDFILNLGKISTRAEGTHCFLAEDDGRPVAAGGMSIADDVALLAGASTVLSARKRGAQRALLHARLQFAAQHGCTIAMMAALPGSASQRNAERQGFRIAYTRVKWHRRRS